MRYGGYGPMRVDRGYVATVRDGRAGVLGDAEETRWYMRGLRVVRGRLVMAVRRIQPLRRKSGSPGDGS